MFGHEPPMYSGRRLRQPPISSTQCKLITSLSLRKEKLHEQCTAIVCLDAKRLPTGFHCARMPGRSRVSFEQIGAVTILEAFDWRSNILICPHSPRCD